MARSSATTTRPSRSTTRFPSARSARAPDPILDGVSRAYGGAFAAYARNELGFKTEMTYSCWRATSPGIGTGRAAARGRRRSDLRVLLSFDPSFHVLIAHGYSDMVTPYAMTRYLLDHMPAFTPPGRVRSSSIAADTCSISMPDSRTAFSADAAAFYRRE